MTHIAPRLSGRYIGTDWLQPGSLQPFLQKRAEPLTWYDAGFSQGLVSASTLASDSLAWTAFVHRSRAGAAAAGFTPVHSAKLVAAIGEIYGNVIDHSGNVPSGYVAYRATPRQFEFVIGDRGVGVLESLRSNPQYAALTDSGSALELALQKGVSRYSNGDHGFGFVPLFVGLANISRVMRFRSGNHARIITRSREGEISSATRERASCPGFFCSVFCDLE